MKKTTTFTFNIAGTNSNNTSFLEPTNYSKTLDNIITANIKKANPYLNMYSNSDSCAHSTTIFINNGCYCSDFDKAAKFLAEYNKKKDIKSKFILGKTYTLSDGTPIIFYEDEIQIGFDLYSYSDFANTTFIKNMSSATKNLIINIYNIKL